MVAPSYWKCWHHSWLGCRFSWNGSCVPLVASDRVERTKALNQAVKRNINRFPDDFMFQLTKNELESLRSQIVTSNSTEKQQDTNWKSQIVTSNPSHNDGAKILMSQNATSNFAKMGLRRPPYAFTRNGIGMLSSVLRSETAVGVNILIMRAFTAIPQIVNQNVQMVQRDGMGTGEWH